VDKGGGNTDTIMIGAYDIQKQALSVVSIPRDTMIHSDHSNKKINATFARGGVSGLENSLEDMLGFPVDFYVKVNLAAFEKIVNAVGGVYYDVPPGMQYVDPTQDLYIDLQPGYQLLDGDKALQLVRCRSAYASQISGAWKRSKIPQGACQTDAKGEQSYKGARACFHRHPKRGHRPEA
jgi:LCP family protein required for cell wall assembly